MATISVVIVDAQEVVRLGIRAALKEYEQIAIVGEGVGEVDALQLAEELQPDITLLGLNTYTSAGQRPFASALSLCSTIRNLVYNGKTRVLVLSRYAHKGVVLSMLQAGASGLVLRDEAMGSSLVLAQAIIETARRRKLSLSATLYEIMYYSELGLEEVPQLTRRRIEIMQTIADNPRLTLTQVANHLGIAESTLRNNLSAISRALDTPNLNGAMIECLRLGLVRLEP